MAAADGTVVRATYPAYGAMGGARVAAEVVRQLGPVDDPEVERPGAVDRRRARAVAAGASTRRACARSSCGRSAGCCRRRARTGPLLIVIDDMHHSGDQTLELLGELAGRLGQRRRC